MTCHNRMHDKGNQVVASSDRVHILAPDTTITNVHLKKTGYFGKAIIEGKPMKLRQFGFGVWVPIH